METPGWMDQRRETSGTRKRPRAQQGIYFPADGDGHAFPDDATIPTDLLLQSTGTDGDTAAWFDDSWWMECLSRWKDENLAVHILPSPAGLLHPVVLHHLGMVRRVASDWRLVGHCWLEELDLDNSPEAIAASPYHEVRVIDASMPQHPAGGNPKHPPRIQDLVGRVLRAQRELGRTRPIMTRAVQPPDVGDQAPPRSSTGSTTRVGTA